MPNSLPPGTPAPEPPGQVFTLLTADQKINYLKTHGGGCCPFCGSTNMDAADDLNCEGATPSQKIRCDDCHRVWEDIYTLTEVVDGSTPCILCGFDLLPGDRYSPDAVGLYHVPRCPSRRVHRVAQDVVALVQRQHPGADKISWPDFTRSLHQILEPLMGDHRDEAS